MDYRNGPRHRGSPHPRMPRVGGGHPHQVQQQRGPGPMMNTWQGNTMNTFQNQEETLPQYQQPTMEYHPSIFYSQSPDLMNTTGPPYPFQSYCVPPMYHSVDPMYHQGTQAIPLATTPTPPMVTTPASKLGDGQYLIRCTKCQFPNTLAESELIKKDEEINSLTHQLRIAMAEIDELKSKLSAPPCVLEAGICTIVPLQDGDDGSVSAKVSHLSPDAMEFNPTKGSDSSSQYNSASSEVPVVSAKGINDDSSSEAQNDVGEESQAEESLKPEPQNESNRPVSPPVVKNEVQPIQESPAVALNEEALETWNETPEPNVPQDVKPEQQEPEENNNPPAVADSDWADDELSVTSASAATYHPQDNHVRNTFNENKNRNYRNPNYRKREDLNNHSGFGRGKNNRRNDQEGYKPHNRNMSERGGRYGNKNQSYSNEHNDRHFRDKDHSQADGPQNDNENQFKDREDSFRGSRESLHERQPYRGGRRGNFHYKDNYNRHERDWNQDQPKGDGPAYRGRGGGSRGRSHEDSYNRYENRRNNQSNGGNWSPAPSPPIRNVVQEVQDDLFLAPSDFSLAHCVAKDFRMGSGIAVKFKMNFKRVPELLAQEVDVGGCAYLKVDNRYVFYLVTKEISRGKPTYDTFRQSLCALKEKCKEFNVTKLAIPHIGCGLDLLDWTKVKSIINELFHDIDIQITAYEFNASPNYYKKKQNRRNDNQYSIKKWFSKSNKHTEDISNNLNESFNDEGLPEAEVNNKHLNPHRPIVLYHHMELTAIASSTALVFFGTEDGHLDSTAQRLDKKFKFALDYKRSPKTVGKMWCYDKPSEYHLYSLIVSKTHKDKVTFATLDSCVREMVKRLRKDLWEYVGIEAFVDWSQDKTFTERVVTLLRNTLPKPISELWVCFPDPSHDVLNMVKTPASQLSPK